MSILLASQMFLFKRNTSPNPNNEAGFQRHICNANSCVRENPPERAPAPTPALWLELLSPPPSHHVPRGQVGQLGLLLRAFSQAVPSASNTVPLIVLPAALFPQTLPLALLHPRWPACVPGTFSLGEAALWSPLQAPRTSHPYNKVQSILAGWTPTAWMPSPRPKAAWQGLIRCPSKAFK